MKKVLFFILFLLITFSCNWRLNPKKEILIVPPISTEDPSYVFEKIYEEDEEEQSVKDVFFYYDFFGFDSIPIKKWMSSSAQDGNYKNILQYTSYGEIDSLIIIFNYYIIYTADIRLYQVKIRKEVK